MSPEQALANPVGPQSDLYSISAVTYELMTLNKSAPSLKLLKI